MLTEAIIKKAEATGKGYKIADARSFYLYVTKTGVKSFRLDITIHSKRKTIVIGQSPDLSLREARIKAEFIRNEVYTGNFGKTKTFRDVAMEWGTNRQNGWTPMHKNYRRLENYVFPFIGNSEIGTVKPTEILKLLRRIEDTGRLETVGRVKNIISQVYRYAMATDIDITDPTIAMRGALKPPPESHFDAILDEKELRLYIAAVSYYPGLITVKTALALLPHLFVRPFDLRHMQWADIDFTKKEWRFNAKKNGFPMVVPLSRQVYALLDDLRTFTGGHRYCFPSFRRGDEKPFSDTTMLVAIRRMGFSSTAHGFRATFRTLGDEVLGFRVDLMEHQLGHAVKDANGRAYNRATHLEARRDMMQAWSDWLDICLKTQ